MNIDVEASENTKLFKSRDFEIKTTYSQENQLFKLLACFALLSLSSYVAYYLNSFNLVKIKPTNLIKKIDQNGVSPINDIIENSSEIFKSSEILESADSRISEDLKISKEFSMMSLAGATPNSQFNACQSRYNSGERNNVEAKPGCISLFTDDLSVSKSSYFISFCGCETIGPKKYDFVSLQKAKLVSMKGAGLISYIVTGEGASITLYNSAEFDGEHRIVIGPNTRTAASQIVRGDGTWDNEIFSIILQSWTSCNLPPVVCAPLITDAPVTSPTYSPFIQPTVTPTFQPVVPPTEMPTIFPTPQPSQRPRARPSMEPLAIPTLRPSMEPTRLPTQVPTLPPSAAPSLEPTPAPSLAPINTDPTLEPTMAPTLDPKLVICKGKLGTPPAKLTPNEGCASLFWSSFSALAGSYVSTVCSCTDIGQLLIPNAMMAKIGAARDDGFPTLSSITMGNLTSLTIYATDDNSGSDKFVLGPGEIVDLYKIPRLNGGFWNDRVRSLQIMSWSKCVPHKLADNCINF